MVAYIERLTPKDRALLLILPFLVFGFLSYQFLMPISSNVLLKSQSKLQNMEAGYIESKSFFENFSLEHFNKKVAILESDIEKNKALLKQYEDGLTKINSKYATLNKDLNWVNLLNHITTSATTQNITLGNITDISEKEKTGFHFKLEGSGEYKNILRFINSLESYNAKLKVSKLNISQNSSIKFSIEINSIVHSL